MTQQITPEALIQILAKHKAWLRGEADGARANLADADLADADLAGADLAGADLAGANLAGANLAGAYLAGANLAGAYLAGANLAGAYLAGAYLAGAYLAGAYLAGARDVPVGIEKTDPPEPYKRAVGAVDYAARAESYRKHHPEVPVIPNLDKRILDVVESGEGTLDMGNWHTCQTKHCRAGWAIHFGGAAGYALEKRFGSAVAGRMIYIASTGRSAHFFASTADALEDIRARAAEAVQP